MSDHNDCPDCKPGILCPNCLVDEKFVEAYETSLKEENYDSITQEENDE